jgi:uncharacterized protein YabE (DUF348 family)
MAMVFISMGRRGITLVVDGRPHAVPSMDGSVRELLAEHGIAVDASDQIVPSPSTQVADGMTVTVDRTTSSGSGVGVWVVEGAGRSARLGVAAELAGSPSSQTDSVGRSPISAVAVVVRGKGHDVLTNARTVGELLSAMGITPDGDDRVLPPPSTPLRSTNRVRYTSIRVVTRDVERPVPFRTTTTVSSQLQPGTSRVIRTGERGSAVETYQLRLADGRVVDRTLEDRRVTDAPVAQLRVVGPAVEPDETGSGGDSTASGGMGHAGSQLGDATWYDPPWSGMTAAHPWLPLGTMVTVTNLANGRSVAVRINDRGPYAPGRIIDLAPEAFQVIAPLSQGVANVRISW